MAYGPQLQAIHHSSLDPVCKLPYCPQSHVLFVNLYNTRRYQNDSAGKVKIRCDNFYAILDNIKYFPFTTLQ